VTFVYFVLAAVWLIAGVTITKCLTGASTHRNNIPHDERAGWLAGAIWGVAFAVAFSAWLVMWGQAGS
jgi:hypothetical protein